MTVVVGGWGRDDDGLFSLQQGPREKFVAIDANLELLSPQKTWTDLSSVEVVSLSGRDIYIQAFLSLVQSFTALK